MQISRRIAIIDYGSGNLRSVAKAFEHVADNNDKVIITANPQDISRSTHIVLPGVGAFKDCMQGLKALPGMIDALYDHCYKLTTPFLGICVGMQMLFEKGHEYGVHEGLGWLKGEVVTLSSLREAIGDEAIQSRSPHGFAVRDDNALKIPHMGWNDLHIANNHPLLKGIATGDHAYFVHSYHAVCHDASDVLATVDYGQTVTAVVGRGNIMGTQFHPEKSQATGLRLLKNFLDL